MKILKKFRKMIQSLIDYIPPEARKLLPMAGIALMAIVLIAVIILFQSCGRRNNEESSDTDHVFDEIVEETLSPLSESEGIAYEDEESSGPVSVTEPETEPETEPDYGNLKKNSEPDILDVMQRYFDARARADLDTINELYGITDQTEEERAEDEEVLEFNARYVSSFDNINTYVMEGPYNNSWLVYTTTDVNFYTSSTKAPTIMWCFVEKTDDGEYRILDSHGLSEDLIMYAETENHSPEVRSLAADVNESLREALESDPDLEEVYGVLRSGSPLWENTSEAETAVAVVEDEDETVSVEDEEEAEEAAESEADTESAAEAEAEDTEADETGPQTESESEDAGEAEENAGDEADAAENGEGEAAA